MTNCHTSCLTFLTWASITGYVENALKTIGMSVTDYKKNSSLKSLVSDAEKLLQQTPDDLLSSDYITTFTEAVEVLKKYHGHHADVSKSIKGGRDSLEDKLKS